MRIESSDPGDFSRAEKKSPGLSVLVVDDEPLIRWSLAEALSECGYRVTEGGDAQAARNAIRDTPEGFDVILLDLRLPDSKDLTLLAAIRAAAPRTEVILMTAHGTRDVAAAAIELGAFRVVMKPFELGEMTNLVAVAGRRPS
jgi:two-component system, NtrC family, response regulator AtoC